MIVFFRGWLSYLTLILPAVFYALTVSGLENGWWRAPLRVLYVFSFALPLLVLGISNAVINLKLPLEKKNSILFLPTEYFATIALLVFTPLHFVFDESEILKWFFR